MTRTDAGLRALSKATPIDPASVQRYVHSKFGEALDDAYAAMQQLATSRPPEVLAAEAYQLYEHFGRPFPAGAKGWGAKERWTWRPFGSWRPQESRLGARGVPGRLTSQVVAGARCVAARRIPMMNEPLQIAEVVRQACLTAALRAYEDAGLSGLCQEGRWECTVEAIRALPLRPLLQGLSEGQKRAEDGSGTRHVTGSLL